MTRGFRTLITLAILVAACTFLAGQQPNQQQLEQMRMEQQRQEAERRAAEQRQREEEARRKQFTDSIRALTPVDLSRTAPRQVTEPCLAQALTGGFTVDPRKVPLEEWLAKGETTQFSWKVQVQKPRLRIDQRYEIAYNVTVQGKDLQWSKGPQELVFASGISRPDGHWIVPPKAGKQTFSTLPQVRFQVRFSNCVFVQPGDYFLWITLYDRGNARHNVVLRRVRISEFPSDLLPRLNSALPKAEFPGITGGRHNAPETNPGMMRLPITNKRPLAVELVPILTPADQWPGRTDIVRRNNNGVLSAAGILSQMDIASGSIRLRALDLVNVSTPFQQREFRQLDWTNLSSAFTKVEDNHQVSLPALEALKQRSGFFKDLLLDGLGPSAAPLRVFILISGSILFERGTDVSPLKWEGDCNCRIYHIRFRVSKDDVFDDLAKLMKPLRPRTFDISDALDFREALAEIVQDLDGL